MSVLQNHIHILYTHICFILHTYMSVLQSHIHVLYTHIFVYTTYMYHYPYITILEALFLLVGPTVPESQKNWIFQKTSLFEIINNSLLGRWFYNI